MNIEDIKVGETYNVRVKVEAIDEDGWFKVRTSEKAISFVLSPKEQGAFSLLPKYDPCRPFKEGDSVRAVERYGRKPDDGAPVNVICEVVEDERKNGTVAIRARGNCGSVRFRVTALYLELVTPVEEMEPYSVGETTDYFSVDKEGDEVSTYWKDTHPNAKTAAENECARLNAEWRKEMEK